MSAHRRGHDNRGTSWRVPGPAVRSRRAGGPTRPTTHGSRDLFLKGLALGIGAFSLLSGWCVAWFGYFVVIDTAVQSCDVFATADCSETATLWSVVAAGGLGTCVVIAAACAIAAAFFSVHYAREADGLTGRRMLQTFGIVFASPVVGLAWVILVASLGELAGAETQIEYAILD